MVWKTAIKRVKNGKTLRIDVDIENNIIKDIVISGDFFVYPEDSIDKLEECLRKSKVDEINDCIDKILNTATLVGVSADDIKDILYGFFLRSYHYR